MDVLLDASGLFAVAGHPDAAGLTVAGLLALQHRGTAGVSIAVADGGTVRQRFRAGLVSGGVGPEELPAGNLAIGQVFGRGESEPVATPHDERLTTARYRGGALAVAVSGLVTQGARLRRELSEAGALFRGPSDAELLLHLVATSGQKRLVNRVIDALWRAQGAYSLVLVSEDHLVAVRDPKGFRPLVLGKRGDAHLVATEDGAIRAIGGEVRRDVRPGEMIVVDSRGLVSISPFPTKEPTACVQEALTLSRSDARFLERPVHTLREALGARLAALSPAGGVEVVCAAPGAEDVARGFARVAGAALEPALLADDPLGWTKALLPDAELRWRAVPAAVRGRSVALVAASLTTGRALRSMVTALGAAGAREVHVRLGSPPVVAACPYGVASPVPEELLTRRSVDPVAELGATSLAWLSRADVSELAGSGVVEVRALCEACLSQEAPLPTEPAEDQLPLF